MRRETYGLFPTRESLRLLTHDLPTRLQHANSCCIWKSRPRELEDGFSPRTAGRRGCVGISIQSARVKQLTEERRSRSALSRSLREETKGRTLSASVTLTSAFSTVRTLKGLSESSTAHTAMHPSSSAGEANLCQSLDVVRRRMELWNVHPTANDRAEGCQVMQVTPGLRSVNKS